MIKKTIKYEDLEGNEVAEDFYFHLNKLEMVELDAKHGGLENITKNLSETEDGLKVYNIFKDLLLSSYGKRSDDGRRFFKADPVTGAAYRYDLEGSDALGEMILEMIEDPNKALELIKGLVPAKAQEAIAQAEAKRSETNDDVSPAVPELPTAPPVVEKKEPTDEELLSMKPVDLTREQLLRVMKLKSQQ